MASAVELSRNVWECHFIGTGSWALQSTFRWMVICYTAITSVGWWKNFSFTILLNSGGSLTIHLRLVWRQFYHVMETSTHQYKLFMQFAWKNLLNHSKFAEKIRYEHHQWNIYAGLKVLAMLTELPKEVIRIIQGIYCVYIYIYIQSKTQQFVR